MFSYSILALETRSKNMACKVASAMKSEPQMSRKAAVPVVEQILVLVGHECRDLPAVHTGGQCLSPRFAARASAHHQQRPLSLPQPPRHRSFSLRLR